MSTRVPLRGGSAGEPVKITQLPYFHDGVKAIELIQKNTYGLRILPAFKYDPNTMALIGPPTSYIPYRDRDKIDPETQRPVFTEWYFPLKVHKMIGNGQRSFTSPLMGEFKDAKDVDPLHNIWLVAKNSENPDWRNLTEKEKDEYNPVLRKYRIFYVVNALLSGQDNKLENRLVVMTGETLNQLKKKLNQRGGRGDPVLDHDWEDYCFGDVTSPKYGLWATVKPGVFNEAGMKTSLFYFGNQPQDDRPLGVVPYPIDENADWGQAFLAGRYNIADTEKVTKISYADQILQYIVEDDYLPYDLVQEACAYKWELPAQSTHRKTYPGSATAPPTGQPGVQHDQAAAPAAAPAAAQPSLSRKFWMVMGGQVKGPFPESLVMAQVVGQHQDIQICLEGSQEWHPASSFGINVPAAPKPPPAPPSAPPPPPGANPGAPPPPGPSLAPGAPPAPMTSASTAPPPPVATGMPPRPAGPPPTPPGGNSRPTPVQPNLTAPAPPGVNASAGAPPAPQTAQPAANSHPIQPPKPAAPDRPALNPAELTEYHDLFSKWTVNNGAGAELLPPDALSRFAELSDRAVVNGQAIQG